MDAALINVEADSALPNQTSSEPAPADQCSHVEEITPDSAAIGHGWKVSNISGQSAEISGVIGQPFQFERNAPQEGGTRRSLTAGKSFRGVAKRCGMADCGISGGCLHKMNPAFDGPARYGRFYAAVLVSQ